MREYLDESQTIWKKNYETSLNIFLQKFAAKYIAASSSISCFINWKFPSILKFDDRGGIKRS